jgi:hypothetical protein
MNDIIIVQHSLVALISLHLGVWELIIIVCMMKLIIIYLLVLIVLNLSDVHFSLHLSYLWLGWSFTQLFILYSHIELVKLTWRDLVVEIQELSFDGL